MAGVYVLLQYVNAEFKELPKTEIELLPPEAHVKNIIVTELENCDQEKIIVTKRVCDSGNKKAQDLLIAFKPDESDSEVFYCLDKDRVGQLTRDLDEWLVTKHTLSEGEYSVVFSRHTTDQWGLFLANWVRGSTEILSIAGANSSGHFQFTIDRNSLEKLTNALRITFNDWAY